MSEMPDKKDETPEERRLRVLRDAAREIAEEREEREALEDERRHNNSLRFPR